MVKQLEQAVRARLDEICRDNGITTTQYTALSVLFVKPGMSSAQLAVRSFMKPQSAHQTVRELESKGYIRRVPDEMHRRTLRINLTSKGRGHLDACNRAVDRLETEMLQGVLPSESSELQRLMGRCLRNLSPPS